MQLLDNSVLIYQEACLSVTRDRKDFCDFFYFVCIISDLYN